MIAEQREREHDYTMAVTCARRALKLSDLDERMLRQLKVLDRPRERRRAGGRHSDGLPERYRQLLEAFDARQRGAMAEAESLYVTLLRSHPDDREAWFQLGTLRTPKTLPWGRPIHLAPSRLRMGELYEQLGERERAIEQYVRFVKLWQDCDPEHSPLVEDVRRRIVRLRARPDPRTVR